MTLTQIHTYKCGTNDPQWVKEVKETQSYFAKGAIKDACTCKVRIYEGCPCGVMRCDLQHIDGCICPLDKLEPVCASEKTCKLDDCKYCQSLYPSHQEYMDSVGGNVR